MTIMPQALVGYSPITQTRLAPGKFTLRELCRAAVSYSDNTAANSILEVIGGAGAVTRFMRLIGDNVTRLDRLEPSLNEAVPGDVRDTTTPASVVAALRTILATDVLTLPHRQLLQTWMMDDQVAGDLLRASLPTGWRIADKTGAGGYGSRSIIAAVYPDPKQLFYIAIYITQTAATLQQSNRVAANIGKIIFR
nr:class A beta-lactamase [Sodalis praecaptivus]